ncbi:MAG: amidohydrolase family protein [Dehalococcoidia bacterium]
MTGIVIRGGRIVDGRGGVIEGGTVVLEGDRIVSVTGPGEPAETEGATVLDATGKVVMPGLIACHEHLTFMNTKGEYLKVVAEDPIYLTLRCVKSGLVLLSEGVTTIREMGAREGVNVHYKRAVERGMIVGPRTYSCVQSIIMTGGTGHLTSRAADGPDECRKAARELLFAGADFIKVKASGNATSPRLRSPYVPNLTVEEMRAAFEEAHKNGKSTASHAMDRVSIENSIEAGVDVVDHGHELTDAICETMVERGLFLIPTMTGHWQNAFNAARWGRPTRGVATWPEHFDSFKLALKHGVKIATGCDGVGNVHQEMELMVEGGMSCMDALIAGTRRGAEVLEIDRQVGTIAPGKWADLLILDRDPLQDITNTRSISTVIARGAVHSVEAILSLTGDPLA